MIISTLQELRRTSSLRSRNKATEEEFGSPRKKHETNASPSVTADMEVRTFLLTTVGFLGFLSGLLGFLAEGKKLAENGITRLSATECVHSRSPSFVLGVVAAISVLIAQIISNALGGCICCESGHNGPHEKNAHAIVAIMSLTLSWVTFSIAFLLLLAGASINDRHGASDDTSTGCFVLKSGVFTGAAFAAFMTTILGIAYNFQVTSVRKKASTVLLGIAGTNSSEENTSNSKLPLDLQQCSIGQPILSTSQQPETGPASEPEIHPKRILYSKSAVNNDKAFKDLQLAENISEKQQTYTHFKNIPQVSRQTIAARSPIMSEQNQQKPQLQSSQNTWQSASAAYMPVVTENIALPNTWNTSSISEQRQTESQSRCTRQGVGRVWEQSKYYQGASKHA